MIELLDKRQHNIKYFIDPNKPDRDHVIKQCLGLWHYHDGVDFKDIEHIPFPEGKEIKSEADLEMVDVPAWATCEISKDGKSAVFVDKKGVAIQEFRKAFICDKDVEPHSVVDKDGKKTKLKSADLVAKTQTLDLSKREKIVVDESKITAVKFAVKNGKLAFELPTGIEAKNLKAFDDTNTSSTNDGDTVIWSYSSMQNGNYGSDNIMDVYAHKDGIVDRARSLIKGTLASGSGTVSDVELDVYEFNAYAAAQANAHAIIQTGWTELGATWNKYNGTSNWATAGLGSGTDYNATIIGHTTIGNSNGWKIFPLMGASADNPLTLTWGSSINLLLRMNAESGFVDTYQGAEFYTKEYPTDTAKRPFFKITFTPASSFIPKMIMI